MRYAEKFYKNEAQAFVDEHPDYISCPENCEALFDRLKEKGLTCNRETLATVYEELKAEGELKLRMVMPYDSGS